jgi:NDP-sugar pyrophosphorylase family protein
MIGHALVLTAGLGTRLRPLTSVRAKPAVPVAGDPIVRRIIRWLAGHGVNDLVLNLHNLPHTLTRIVGDGSDLGVRVRYSWEQPDVLGSAGGPRRALPMIDGDTFFIVNGDTMTDLDLKPMADAHRRSGSLVTMALVANREPHRYGGVILDDAGAFAGFARRGEEAVGSFHFIGVQLAHADAFREVPDGRVTNVHEIYETLIRSKPGCIRGHVSDASFWDIGTPEDYWQTNATFLRDPPRQAGPARPGSPGRGTRIDPASRITHSILWDDVEVQPGAVLEECIVTDGVTVSGASTYRRSILIRSEQGLVVSQF